MRWPPPFVYTRASVVVAQIANSSDVCSDVSAMAHQPTAWDRPQSGRTASFREHCRRNYARGVQAIHPLLMVAVFTARLRKRSEIVAVFTAKCWELLACGFHRQCTRVGFRRCIMQRCLMQRQGADTCRHLHHGMCVGKILAELAALGHTAPTAALGLEHADEIHRRRGW